MPFFLMSLLSLLLGYTTRQGDGPEYRPPTDFDGQRTRVETSPARFFLFRPPFPPARRPFCVPERFFVFPSGHPRFPALRMRSRIAIQASGPPSCLARRPSSFPERHPDDRERRARKKTGMLASKRRIKTQEGPSWGLDLHLALKCVRENPTSGSPSMEWDILRVVPGRARSPSVRARAIIPRTSRR